MHILVVNDDGPPSNQSSPYIHSLVVSLQSAGHTVSVVLPHQQRSWIGKAHLIGAAVKPTYFRPGTLHKDDGTTHELPHGMNEGDDESYDGDEWILVDSTPASCVQIGLYHYFEDRGPIDLVVSGPNYGRNSTALFAMSSGTIGGAMEAAVCGKRAIALSYAFSSRQHDPVVIAEASRHSVRLIEYLHNNWAEGVDLYSINVPLEPGVSEAKVLYTHMLDNRWSSGSCFKAVEASASTDGPSAHEHKLREESESAGQTLNEKGSKSPSRRSRIQHKHFEWAPNFTDVYKSVDEGTPGNDGWVVKEGMTSVTPLKANFMHTPGIEGEIKLQLCFSAPSFFRFASPVLPFEFYLQGFTHGTIMSCRPDNNEPTLYTIVDCDNSYVQSLIEQALQRRLGAGQSRAISSLTDLPSRSAPVFQYREYERLDFEHAMMHSSSSLANAYIIRKALIRKHYLSNTVANWVTKHPDSVLAKHFKFACDFELDYAEFLDDALLEAYELRESLERNETLPESEKEWWILKAGMSDRGQGIRLFNSEDGLREIFEEWDPDSDDEEAEESDSERAVEVKDEEEEDDDHGVVTSQLRHFIAQPYIDPPLLLPSASNRKFHIRTYVLAVGSLKVYVFREMLALFAAKPYCPPGEEDDEVKDLARHLTNTCFQEGGSSNEGSVRRYWQLDESVPGLAPEWKENLFDQICAVTGEIFEAAARGMMVHFQTLPNAFELFGVDFLVDQSGNAWLLELNAYPDFAQTGEELKDLVVGRLFEETVDVAVKPFFGLGDAAVKGTESMRLVADLELGRKA
ncbi:putative acid phosphatase [Aspergillus saccharolyticus JOP 1030-1]|uniref:Putative tubulin-tyrosine ligase n=1 Tax=Aspergillus saccharolyticus JOP 1030-1 TaxID=1450539 RepID=A0A318Z7Z6_9EURO|nr:putative tubulin-tyrosine ligase [Aspergillus saccharolyticus JOP 1030-1]PYH43326.1 putative tubulin-tyrosine ligase [Aspergillus saccharolyticus JOP 1030-1]